MADIGSLIGEQTTGGKVTVSVDTGNGKTLEYDLMTDGSGNLIGAYERGYDYVRKDRMLFSILRNPADEGLWRTTYAINVLANLIGIDESLCSSTFDKDTDIPAGGVIIEPIPIDDAIAKAEHEYKERQIQFNRLGINKCSPDDIYIHTLLNEDHTDIERLISKADQAFASLTGIIELSPGFDLSAIYKTIADGVDDHNLSIDERTMDADGENAYHDRNRSDGHDDRSDLDVPAPQNMYSAMDGDDQDESDDTPFASLDWDGIIQDEQHEIQRSIPALADDGAEMDDVVDTGHPDDVTAQDDIGLPSDGGAKDTEARESGHGSDADDDGNDGDHASIVRSGDDEDADMEDMGEEDDDPDKTGDSDDGNGIHDDGGHPEGEVRDDVIGYIDSKIDTLKREKAEQDRIVGETKRDLDGLEDESDELEGLEATIAETKARLASMEENRRDMETSVKETKRKRAELTERRDKARRESEKLDSDMKWLDHSRGLIKD